MKHDSHTTTSRWSIGEWRLGWKVIAVLALPMIVAVVLGALRVQTELEEAAQLSSSSERALAVPAAINLESALYELAEAASARPDTRPATQAVSDAMDQLVDAARTFQSDDALNDQVTSALTESRSITEEIAAGAVAPARLVSRVGEVSRALSSTFTSVVEHSQRPVLREQGGRLSALWEARRALAEQRILFGSGDPDQQARTSMVSAAGAELVALNNILAIDGTNDTVQALSNSAQNRINELGSTPSTSPPGSRVGADLKSGKDQYNSLTDTTVTEFGDAVTAESNAARTAALRDTAIVLGAVLLALAIALVISRSLIDPIRRLRFAALQAARRGLPDAIERIRAGASTDELDFARVPIRTHEEIGELARAVDDMHGQAITLAGEQATLRRQVNDMFETLSRRNKSLVDQQLGLIEQLEQDEDDPRRLENLFRLDHIAARMRRNGDNLLVLAGTDVRRARTAPIALGDTLRAAVSGVEEYRRVELGQTPPGVVTGHAAPDVVHLIAELLDNSLRYSPPETTVSINAATTIDGSMIVEIADLGIGMSPADILDANERLAAGAEMSADTARRMGLFVVSRISRRYNISVRLRPTATSSTHSGITATVLLPTSILDSSRTPEIRTPQTGPVPTLDRTPPTPTAQSAQSAPSWSQPVPTESAPPRPATRSFADLPRRTPGNSTDQTEAFDPITPQSTPPATAPSGLPRRTPGTSGVPAVSTSTSTTPAPATSVSSFAPLLDPAGTNASTALPVRAPSHEFTWPAQGPEISAGPQPSTTPPPRHRLSAPTPTNTAAFFSSRTRDGLSARPSVRADSAGDGNSNGAPAAPSTMPIFARMVSEWLVDPTAETSAASTGSSWTTDADQGWVAARTSFEMPVTKIADSGLPIRDRGARLVPGAVGGGGSTQRHASNPADVQRGWSSYQSGVQRGRRNAADHQHDGGQSFESSTMLHNDQGEQ
ncbi:ATP-binding protein [Rhodococcus sp. IEGM 1409]|uniref:HAMP domain-containing sensor histidine kinase n=1 Tax=Rhodococcus sp. IEGM 1409 TaxID=3047082 RepID=UPI0024B82F5B|nr:ATP-binding protein [Rhodococcus sp. IEGM 1409]MDI9898795.1 ATP-binding protein [Rhodococcus sp. IEGM 1409]